VARDPEGASAPGSADPPEVIDVSWTEELDERSAVDRVGLHAARGLGSTGDDARLDERLRRGASPAGSGGAGSELGAAGAEAAAAVATGRALGHERDAAQHRSTPDLPDTAGREDLDARDDARVDDQLAAGERAAAAELHGAAAAAATRAEVTFTPPTVPVAPVRAAAPAGAHTRRGPAPRPTHTPSIAPDPRRAR